MIAPARSRPKFPAGQLVRHVRYGYRGVVVEVHPHCQADDAWYRSNQTQPPRNQPWYHVLVDGGQQTTYAAETSLEADPSGRPVEHPLVDLFFSAFDGESYVRNDRAWLAE